LQIFIPCTHVRAFAERELRGSSVPRLKEFFAVADPWLKGYFQMLASELEIFSGFAHELDTLFLAQTELLLLAHLIKWHSHGSAAQLDAVECRPTSNALPSITMRRVHEYVDAHLADDIRLQDLADLAHVSPGHFLRAFRAASDITPYQYVQEQRLQKARSMLGRTGGPISRVASACGFKTSSRLSATFHRRFGITPSTYRAAAQPLQASVVVRHPSAL
jgi:AraC family transcriptional regulator